MAAAKPNCSVAVLSSKLDSGGSYAEQGRCSADRDWTAFAYLCVGRQSQGQLPCGDVRAVSYLSVVQDLRDVARDRSFKHVYICFRRRLRPVAKASAKELSASYSARTGLNSCRKRS